MSKLILSYVFKTNLAEFRSAIIDDNTDKICRILDIEHDYVNKYIDGRGNTALLLAIEYASPLTIRLLLEQGAQPNQPSRIKLQTPLYLLASKVYEDYNSYKAQRTLEMVKILLDHGAYVDKPSLHIYRDENNKDYAAKETPLMISVRKRNILMTKLLIERKANVNYIERHSKLRAIHFAITNGDEAMYDLLENAGGFNCSIVTSDDNTLLHWFCYKNENDQQINLLKKLLDKGCDINAENWDQRTPLMLAAKNNMSETCRILLKNGADINKHDSNGNQAIDLSKPGSECAKLLLQQIQSSPSIQSTEKLLWKKRIDAAERCGPRLSANNNDEINSPCISSKYSGNGEEQNNGSPHPCIYPNRRRDNDEFEKRYERIWEKFLQTTPKRRVFKNFCKTKTTTFYQS